MFDPTKPVQTRDGRPARIICTDFNNINSIIAIISISKDKDIVICYPKDGSHYNSPNWNLINIPPPKKKFEFWVNIYENDKYGISHPTKASADATAADGRIACVHIQGEEGDGLDGET